MALIDIFSNTLFLVIVALWTIPWKGVALWKAAQNKEKPWFIVILLVNTLAILEILYIFLFQKKKK
jgi:hypothetical protein